jgi:hypothetical protein
VGEPEVLDGADHGVEPGVGDGVATQHVGTAAASVVPDDDAQSGLADALDLDPAEHLGTLSLERRRVDVALVGDVVAEGSERRRRADDHEVPRLAHTHAGCAVRRGQHALEHVRGELLARELAAGVAAAVDHVVQVGGHGALLRMRAAS